MFLDFKKLQKMMEKYPDLAPTEIYFLLVVISLFKSNDWTRISNSDLSKLTRLSTACCYKYIKKFIDMKLINKKKNQKNNRDVGQYKISKNF